jgi:hypothetical protein
MASVSRVLILGSFLLLAVHSGRAFSQAEPILSPPETRLPAGNSLVEEMLVIDQGFRDIVSAVSLGDNRQVRSSLEAVHGAAGKTGRGVRAGNFKLPKNSQRIKEFSKIDHGFQEKLKSLGRTAKHKNSKEMVRITKQILDDCVQCHQIFKK